MATQAYLWALPLVSYAQWQKVHREIFGATNLDLVHYVSYRDRLGLTTANATTPYILNFIDLSETGPLVIELPAGPTAGGLSDFWQREFGVLGEMGPDKGEGGKHLVVPPGEDPPETDGYNVLRATGMNIVFGFRTLDPDPVESQVLVDGVRIYPHAQRENPPETRLISPNGRPWLPQLLDGIETSGFCAGGLDPSGRTHSPDVPGSMFWLRRNTFVGSYSFFSATSRAYVSSPYADRAASVSPRKFTYARPVDASLLPAITARAHSV
jgi:uncharacterized protein DUF1254